MKIVGLITEYNPFHNGHLYHIKTAKKLTDADYVVVVMSGNFLQRGTPAIIDKYSRTRMALASGADLVIELPCAYSTSSAEFFASGSVALLSQMGCIDYLCFGSECGDTEILKKIAFILADEPLTFKELLKKYLKEGLSFPIGRKKALLDYMADTTMTKEELEPILSEPNNILAIEYIKALIKQNSKIIPLAIKRVVSGYHDSLIKDKICSATAIRTAFQTSGLNSFREQVPSYDFDILSEAYNRTFPIYPTDFSSLLKYRLLLQNSKPFQAYWDVSESLANTITRMLSQFKNYEDFANLLKSKQYTFTRINRSLIHILLNLEADTIHQFIEHNYALYIRILGFRKSSTPLLTAIKANSGIPIISKLADAKNHLTQLGLLMLEQDILASDIYNTIVIDKFDFSIPNEFQQQIVIFE